MEKLDILQKIEGVNEAGEAKAACSVGIHREMPGQEPEVVASAFTMNAVVSICITPVWVVVDLRFSDRLDYDLFQMLQVCMDYMEMLKGETVNDSQYPDLVLSIAPVGEYEQFVIGRNGFWSLMSDRLEKYCDTLRFIFPREQFGAYELTKEAVEQMIEEASEEVDAEGASTIDMIV